MPNLRVATHPQQYERWRTKVRRAFDVAAVDMPTEVELRHRYRRRATPATVLAEAAWQSKQQATDRRAGVELSR